MDNTKLYLCFEATDVKTGPVYLIYSANVTDFICDDYVPKPSPKFTLDASITGFTSMGCGLFDSKIVLAGGFSGAGQEREYNRGLITYDTVTKKVSREDFPDMRGRKVRPLVFELYGRLYVLDTSSCVYKRSFEIYYPMLKIWEKLSDPYCNLSGDKRISGITPYSWFVCGNTVSISLPTSDVTYLHHARQIVKLFDNHKLKLPFQGMATTHWEPGFRDVVVISFSKGLVQGRLLKYGRSYFGDSKTIFATDSYEKPDGEISSYFAECGEGNFCLATFDNLNIHVYVFKIRRHEDEDGALFLVLERLDKHKYSFNDFSSGGTKTVSITGCFVLPRDDGTKRSEESKVYRRLFRGYESRKNDDDLPPTIETEGGLLKLDPGYDSGGADSDFDFDLY